jgi:hypothetical protein
MLGRKKARAFSNVFILRLTSISVRIGEMESS